jgi:hypothetical protein
MSLRHVLPGDVVQVSTSGSGGVTSFAGSTGAILVDSTLSFNSGTKTLTLTHPYDPANIVITGGTIAGLTSIAGMSNVLNVVNGNIPQQINVFNSFTDPTNNEATNFIWYGNTFYIQTYASGTGSARTMVIGPAQDAPLQFQTHSTIRWQIDIYGSLVASETTAPPTSTGPLFYGDTNGSMHAMDTSGTDVNLTNLLQTAYDTGWVANIDYGDKTQIIPDGTTVATYQAFLDVQMSGMGDCFFAMAQKIKALEHALSNLLLPNN